MQRPKACAQQSEEEKARQAGSRLALICVRLCGGPMPANMASTSSCAAPGKVNASAGISASKHLGGTSYEEINRLNGSGSRP